MAMRPLFLIAGLALPASALAQITVTSKTVGDHHTIVAQTPLTGVTVVPEWGGRIVSLVDKWLNRELDYFRDGLRGLLDDLIGVISSARSTATNT